MKILLPLLLALASGLASAQAGDPLKSAACGQALAALDQARSGPAPGVQAARDRAAQDCLGSAREAPRAPRTLQVPIGVPPPIITPAPEPPPTVAAPVLPPPPLAIPRPPRVTICDAGGCWADDGTGMRHLPPGLAGPAGLCSQQGGLVYCP